MCPCTHVPVERLAITSVRRFRPGKSHQYHLRASLEAVCEDAKCTLSEMSSLQRSATALRRRLSSTVRRNGQRHGLHRGTGGRHSRRQRRHLFPGRCGHEDRPTNLTNPVTHPDTGHGFDARRPGSGGAARRPAGLFAGVQPTATAAERASTRTHTTRHGHLLPNGSVRPCSVWL